MRSVTDSRWLLRALVIALALVFIVLLIGHVRNAFAEPFTDGSGNTGMCPYGAAWFIDDTGIAVCCDGNVRTLSKTCQGRVTCTFSAGDTRYPQCRDLAKRENADHASSWCPPTLPNLVGVSPPTGCCSAPVTAAGACPTGAGSCTIAPTFALVTSATTPPSCQELRFLERLTCPPTNASNSYTLSPVTWNTSLARNVVTCMDSTTYQTCFPDPLFKSLVQKGNLTGANAASNSPLKCSTFNNNVINGVNGACPASQ